MKQIKKNALAAVVLLFTVGLFGCGEPRYKDGYGNMLYYGNITIIDENGDNITKYCKKLSVTMDDESRINENLNSPKRYSYDWHNYSVREKLTASGFYIHQAQLGNNSISPIQCDRPVSNTFSYYTGFYIRIPSVVSVEIPNDNVAVYFGDVVIKLNKDFTYNVKMQGFGNKSGYSGDLPVIGEEPAIIKLTQEWSGKEIRRMNLYTP